MLLSVVEFVLAAVLMVAPVEENEVCRVVRCTSTRLRAGCTRLGAGWWRAATTPAVRHSTWVQDLPRKQHHQHLQAIVAAASQHEMTPANEPHMKGAAQEPRDTRRRHAPVHEVTVPEVQVGGRRGPLAGQDVQEVLQVSVDVTCGTRDRPEQALT